MELYEKLNIAIQLLSVLLVSGTLLYLAKQVKVMTKTHNENHDWNRRIATQDALKEFTNIVDLNTLQEEFDYLNRKQPIEINYILKKFDKNKNLQVQIHKLLNQYETFSRGIFQGVYDEKIIINARKSSMERTFNSFSDYISYRRNELGSPASFIEFERLLTSWKNKSINLPKQEGLGKIL